MKKGALIYSAIVAVLVCWALLFKVLHWPGGNIMSFAAAVLGVIAVVWMACTQNILGKGVSIFNAIVLVLTIVGLWFKVAHWPGANILLLACLAVLLPVAIIWSACNYLKRNKQ